MSKRLGLGIQHWVARIFVPLTFGAGYLFMRIILRYKWENLREFRAEYQQLVGRDKTPIMVCPNHLTLIDSLILIWAMAPIWQSITHPKIFPWNTPEKRNFAHRGNPLLRFFVYIGKCIPVLRRGPVEKTKRFMAKLQHLLAWGQSLMMFPEGGRSEDGRVNTENFAYGIGKIIDDARSAGVDPRIICVYLRGDRQIGRSDFPAAGSRFYAKAEILDARTDSTGMRASRDLSVQIITKLKAMEDAYFQR